MIRLIVHLFDGLPLRLTPAQTWKRFAKKKRWLP
jgi:hypothetical protein